MYKDSTHKFWDETLDSIDTKNKEPIVNCQVRYNPDGSLDSLNSYYFQYDGEQTISLGDSLWLGLYLAVPQLKEGKIEYSYSFSSSESDSVRIVWSDYRDFLYKYKPQKEGYGKIMFVIREHNLENDEIFDYQQSFEYFVK